MNKNFEKALEKYEKVILLNFIIYHIQAFRYVSHDEFSGDEKKKLEEEELIILGNIAAAKLSMGDYKAAIEVCTKVLDSNPNNLKILLRRGKAYVQRGELDLAKIDLENALKIDPDNKEVKLWISKLRAKEKSLREQEKKAYSKLFA